MVGIRYSYDETFFAAWSEPMAYVLGFIFADGHLINAPEMRGKYVCITNTDLDRIQAIRRLLNSKHRISARERGGNFKTAYQLRIGSKKLFNQLEELGVTPHKSLTMEFPFVPRGYLPAFVRGYFDGDGCVHLEKTRAGGVKKLLTVFTSGSPRFLHSLSALLKREAGVSDKGVYQHGSARNAKQLRYSTRDSLRLFLFMYPPVPTANLYLKRKYAIFNEYLALRKLTRRTIPTVLQTKGPVAKK